MHTYPKKSNYEIEIKCRNCNVQMQKTKMLGLANKYRCPKCGKEMELI
jgi:peptide subunit release factor 1 (eRF1)